MQSQPSLEHFSSSNPFVRQVGSLPATTVQLFWLLCAVTGITPFVVITPQNKHSLWCSPVVWQVGETSTIHSDEWWPVAERTSKLVLWALQRVQFLYRSPSVVQVGDFPSSIIQSLSSCPSCEICSILRSLWQSEHFISLVPPAVQVASAITVPPSSVCVGRIFS